MKQIKLTQNQHTLVDDEDFDNLKQHKWYALYNSNNKKAKELFGDFAMLNDIGGK